MPQSALVVAFCLLAATWYLWTAPPTADLRLRGLRPAAPTRASTLTNTLKARLAALRDRGRAQQRRREAVIELCDGMAAELVAGRTPHDAFSITAASLHPDLAAQLVPDPTCPADLIRPTEEPPSNHPKPQQGTRDSQQQKPSSRSFLQPQAPPPRRKPANPAAPTEPTTGSSPLHHLDALATQPGAEGLRLVAACWRIGAERGGALATVLDGLATALRDEEAQRREVSAQLAGPRATARLLAALPLLGLGMAAALGAHPMAFLLGTLPGAACLVTGIALNTTGLFWTRRLATAAGTPR